MNYFFPKVNILFVVVLFILCGSVVFFLIAENEPTPYIDEIFHINQCQVFCQGDFSRYHPKITTPPGLYAITLILITPLSFLFNINLCTVVGLRFINFSASLVIMYFIYQTLRKQFRYSGVKSIFIALNLTTFPLLYFYYFFYYTDIISTVFILMTYYSYKNNHSHLGGITGLISVTIRQTNILWFFFFAANKCYKNLENDAVNSGRVTYKNEQSFSYIKVIISDCFRIISPLQTKKFVLLILKETYLFILTSLYFLYFLWKNESIVLGDKSAHELSVHLPQLLYFVSFTCIFSFPFCIDPLFKFFKIFRTIKLYLCICIILIALVVSVNTKAHLFLISDNRHYTFYIWKRIFEKPISKYAIIPVYIISAFCIIMNTTQVELFTKITFIISVVFSLVPQKLLEFRYFIIPYLIYRIESSPKLLFWHLWLELLFNIFINYITIMIFLNYPFKWPDGSVQRFSW